MRYNRTTSRQHREMRIMGNKYTVVWLTGGDIKGSIGTDNLVVALWLLLVTKPKKDSYVWKRLEVR